MSPAILNETNQLYAKDGLILPKCTIPYRREIFVGRGVSIYFDRQAPASWPEHSHSQLELMLLGTEALGQLGWRRPDGSWCLQHLRGPQVCVIPRNVPHTCGWLEAADMILLYVEPTICPGTMHTAIVDVWVHDFAALAGHDLIVLQLAASLRDMCRQSGAPDPLIVESMGTLLAERLIRAHMSAREGECFRGGLSPSQLDRVLVYINQHLGRRLPVTDLAREARLSSCHFIRLFKESTGLPPHQYVLKSRLLRAKEMLCTGEFRVAEAAYESGFCDQSHLNRHFRKFFGFTPKALLKKRHFPQ